MSEPAKKQRAPKEFEAYAIGLCNASVCSALTPEETVERMNRENPTGIASTWQLSKDETFLGGQPNPCPCHDNPETHTHYLMEC